MNKYIIPVTLALVVVGSLYLYQTNNPKDVGIQRELSINKENAPQFTQFNELSAKVSEAPETPQKAVETKLSDDNKQKTDKATYSLSFDEGSEVDNRVYFEKIHAYLGYNTKDKKGNKLSFAVDLSSDQLITGDHTQSEEKLKWGITCDAENSCTDQTVQKEELKYDQDTIKADEWSTGKTMLYFNGDQKYDDFNGKDPMNVAFIKNNNSTWHLDHAGVIGMAPNSEFLKKVVKDYGVPAQFSFFYDVMNKDKRFTADAKDSFAITMNWFGQNKGNLQSENKFQNLKTVAPGSKFWTVEGTVSDKYTTNDHFMVTNRKNAYMALPTDQKNSLITRIQSLLGCNTPCPKSSVDLTDEKLNDKYVKLALVNDGDKDVILSIPVVDLVYKVDHQDNLVYSIDDFKDWVTDLNIVTDPSTPTVTAGLGRQFLLNTYVVFNVESNKSYLGVGQLKDLGKITDTERLWLMVFGATIVGLILIVLIIKLATGKKQKPENTSSEGDYLKHDS